MKKSLMSNIKHFVDSNVRQRIDRVANNNNEFFDDDLLLVERQFEDIRHVCVEAEKRISSLLQSTSSTPLNAYTQNVQASLNNLSSLTGTTTTSSPQPLQTATTSELSVVSSSSRSKSSNSTIATHTPVNEPSSLSNNHIHHANLSSINNDTTAPKTAVPTELGDDIRKHKKLPIVGFLKFLVKSCHKLKPDSLLATTLTHCSQLQTQLTHLYLTYEQTIESQCLKPIQQLLEVDVPNIIKLRKLFIKSHNDLESLKAKYNGASQKQLQQQSQSSHSTSTSYTITQSSAQQANANKLDQLKKELDEAVTRFEQARDTYATELYAFVCREAELVNLFVKFYQYQADYQQQVGNTIQSSLPTLSNTLANTPRKVVFGTQLEEHLRCTGRSISLVIELCIHMLCTNALNEEGLFRISGSLVKIKKLKNAINAWFVTLANQSELLDNNHDQQQQACRSGTQASKLAIYNLFKGIVGQRPLQSTTLVGGDIINNQSTTATNATTTTSTTATTTTTTTRDDSTLTYNCNPSSTQNDDHQHQQLVFDAHTVAGLLKLYLRELPEPLFTHALYDQWIDATVKTLNNDDQEHEGALKQVVENLPKVNYDNLRLLIRFLRLLTTFSESNKMTATNLAIAIAPSLIWAQQPAAILNHQQSSPEQVITAGEQDDLNALNMQMSSIGISASLHALVIENLINRADELFPGEVDFIISDLDVVVDSSLISHDKCLPPQHASSSKGRAIKSTSPTGLSTASSSSFSSSTSATSSEVIKNRKAGSLEGMLNDYTGGSISSTRSASIRPVSVHIQRESSINQQPPPVPPAPLSRSHSRQASDSSTCPVRPSASHNKPPAPPVPPPCTLKRQRNLKATNDQSVDDTLPQEQEETSSGAKPTPSAFTGSLRGTGFIPSSAVATSHSSSGLNTTRPNVPPPSRPLKALSAREEVDNAVPIPKIRSETNDSNPQSDSKSSHSLASSGNLRADFEEINSGDVEDMDISAPISPVVSLGSLSGDSSFDNDSPSSEHSWTECDIENQTNINQSDALPDSIEVQTSSVHHHKQQLPVKPLPRLLKKREHPLQADEAGNEVAVDGKSEKAPLIAPVKPPRSTSPKITQSTPL